MSPEIIKFFSALIEKKIGIVYDSTNQFQLENRLDTVAKFYNLPNVEALYQLALEGLSPAQEQFILDTATNNETSFFRDVKVFNILKTEIVPKLAEKSGGQPVQMWSVACSTGQEAYSLSIMCEEMFRAGQKPFSYSIYATDISEKVLSKAMNAVYTQLEVQRGLPINCLVKYFNSDEKCNWSLKPEFKKLVKFSKINLIEEFNLDQKFDLILCRNVLIYQRVQSKAKIISRLANHLRPGGFLLLGSGESLIGLNAELDFQIINDVTVYRKKSGSAAA